MKRMYQRYYLNELMITSFEIKATHPRFIFYRKNFIFRILNLWFDPLIAFSLAGIFLGNI